MFDRFKKFYTWVDTLSSSVKTLIIVLLSLLISLNFFILKFEDALNNLYQKEKLYKKQAQQYTKEITPQINRCLQTILDKDLSASNILLLNYHNTLTSSLGLSYLYITAITEKRKGLEARSCINEWKELEYLTYGEEFNKVNNNNILRIDSLALYKDNFPNLVYLVHRSQFKSAAFYPIKLDGKPVGMLVVLYKVPRTSWNEYYPKYLAQSIIDIARYLDYENYLIKQKNENRQTKWFSGIQ